MRRQEQGPLLGNSKNTDGDGSERMLSWREAAGPKPAFQARAAGVSEAGAHRGPAPASHLERVWSPGTCVYAPTRVDGLTRLCLTHVLEVALLSNSRALTDTGPFQGLSLICFHSLTLLFWKNFSLPQ